MAWKIAPIYSLLVSVFKIGGERWTWTRRLFHSCCGVCRLQLSSFKLFEPWMGSNSPYLLLLFWDSRELEAINFGGIRISMDWLRAKEVDKSILWESTHRFQNHWVAPPRNTDAAVYTHEPCCRDNSGPFILGLTHVNFLN